MSDYLGIDLKAMRDRLDGLGRWNRVEALLSASEGMANMSVVPPYACVSTSTERAAPSKLIGRHRQRVRQTVSIMFARGSEVATLQDVPDDVELDKKAAIEALVAWTPPGADTALDYVSFGVSIVAEGLIWSELLVAADYHVVKEPTAG